MYLQSEVAKAAEGWERFFTERNLSPTQQERLLAFGRESFERTIDLAEVVWAQGLAENSPEIGSLRRRMGGESDAQLLNALKSEWGDDLFQQWADYQQSNRSRQVTDELASRLYFKEAPITGEQARKLEALLKPTQFGPKPGNDSGAAMAGVAVSRADYVAYEAAQRQRQQPAFALISDAAVAQAPAFLAPTQVAILQRLQVEQLNLIKLARAQAAAPAPPGPR